MKKGQSSWLLVILIAIILTVVVFAVIYVLGGNFAKNLLKGVENIICMIPFLCGA